MTPYERLREFRREQGWSYQFLADFIGVSKTTMIDIEKGNVEKPRIDIAVAIERITTSEWDKDPIRVADWCELQNRGEAT